MLQLRQNDGRVGTAYFKWWCAEQTLNASVEDAPPKAVVEFIEHEASSFRLFEKGQHG